MIEFEPQSLVSEATALPIAPQPQPNQGQTLGNAITRKNDFSAKWSILISHNVQRHSSLSQVVPPLISRDSFTLPKRSNR